MKVIFLDFDGVLNDEGSFDYEDRRRKKWKEQNLKGPVCETFSAISASNFQGILDKYPEVKVVISSTWRLLFSLDYLKAKFEEYGIDSSHIIGITPEDTMTMSRGLEIKQWLDQNPEVTQYIIIDDNDWGISDFHSQDKIVRTSEEFGGLTWGHAREAMHKLKTPKRDESESKQSSS